MSGTCRIQTANFHIREVTLISEYIIKKDQDMSRMPSNLSDMSRVPFAVKQLGS